MFYITSLKPENEAISITYLFSVLLTAVLVLAGKIIFYVI